MRMEKKTRQKVLVADDSEMNRELLIDMLEDEFDIVEAENGKVAVDILRESSAEISVLLLDIMMPEMDGFEVLAFMNRYHWIDDIPVIIISAENAPSYIERAYDFGVTDFINRPFDVAVVRRRVANTLLLTAKQRRLTGIVTEQLYEKQKSNKLMIAILSHIVEFRNGESGAHVVNINTVTNLLLRRLVQKGNPYALSQEDINMISTASALHDIGKLSVPDEVLNKPGKLTDEEYAIMKMHSMMGADMLDKLPPQQREEALVQVAYDICRWHHERYDGRGYPDGIKGDDIPISAQVVSLADVYDALTSERCYKKAFSHETAIAMILDGQCGAFNPLLLECLTDIAETLQAEIRNNSQAGQEQLTAQHIAEQLRDYQLTASERMLQQLEFERKRFQFQAADSDGMLFTYVPSPPMLTFNDCAVRRLGLKSSAMDLENSAIDRAGGQMRGEIPELIKTAIQKTTPEHPTVQVECEVGGKPYYCVCHTIWPAENAAELMGATGRLIPLSDTEAGCGIEWL